MFQVKNIIETLQKKLYQVLGFFKSDSGLYVSQGFYRNIRNDDRAKQ